jgi:hypothetical protein
MLSELESTTEESTDMARRRSKRRSRGGSSLAEARERMEEKGTVGAFGKATEKKIAKGRRSKSVKQRRRATFAMMAKRHFKPLPGRRK